MSCRRCVFPRVRSTQIAHTGCLVGTSRALYRVGGEIVKTMPASGTALAAAEPVYEEMAGWRRDTSGVRRFEELPGEAQDYVRFIEGVLERPICLVSVGPEREQAIRVGG